MSLVPTRSLVPQSRAALRAQFLADVLRGLRAPVKELPCKYFYDDTGSALFEQITALDEYYLTRTEMAIMRRHAPEMAALLGAHCLLIEYGSGSSAKTRLLLDHLADPAGYVPIDISAEQLRSSAQALAQAYAHVEVIPVYGDFAGPLQLTLPPLPAARRVVYFPGSTIGNFEPAATIDFLRRTAALCGCGGGLLLGADLRKDPQVIELAYNDAQGVTAAFNLNLLVRINRELGADFVLSKFSHRSFYNEIEGRIEMHLVSRKLQSAHVGGEQFTFQAGESVRTEYSYKYSLDGLAELAGAAGFVMQRHWLDERKYFCVCYFTVAINPS
jgi:dimethylhistidine N-methyltransferase